MSTPTTAPAGPATRRTGALTPRDLVNVGVFTAIYVVVAMGSGMIGIINPVASLFGFFVGILINGVVTALFFARVPKVGGLAVLGLILGLFMTLTGHPWYSIPVAFGLGLIGALVARSGRFRSPVRNALGFGIFCMWFVGPFLPVVWDRAGYTDYVASSMGREYAEGYVALFSPEHLAFFALAFCAVGFVAELFGERLVRRHFRRAGVA